METTGWVDFPATAWSAILGLHTQVAQHRRARLGQLIETYWKPVFLVLRRFEARDNEEARDLTQGFFLHVLEDRLFERADPQRARFRTFLKACLRNFVAKHDRRENAARRGGRVTITGLGDFDPPAPAPRPGEEPDAAFDREWAVAVYETAMAEMRRRLAERGRERAVRTFEHVDLAPSRKVPVPSYEAAAAELGVSVAAVADDLHVARALLRVIMVELLRETVTTPGDLAEELRLVFGK